MKPRILYVIDGIEFGGGEKIFVQIIESIMNKYNVAVVGHYCGEFRKKIEEYGIPYYPSKMNKLLTILPSLQIAKILRIHKIMIVHSQGARADFHVRIACIISKQTKNVCTVAMPVEGFDLPVWRKSIYRLFDWILESQVDLFIVVSKSLKELLILKRNIPSKKVVFIPNGVDLNLHRRKEKRITAREKYGIRDDAVVVGAVGRLVWQKGFECLIQAMPVIEENNGPLCLAIAGDGVLRKHLEDLAEALRMESEVRFMGFCKKIDELMAAFDLLVVPSLREGFPLVVLEGMASGLPLIATDIKGINEQIVHGYNGLLIKPNSPKDIAQAVNSILSDSKLKERISHNAKMTAEEKYGIGSMLKRTEQEYRKLMTSS